MDLLDIKILTELQKNARKSFAEIGRLVGLSSPAVTERVQKMEELGVIHGYSVCLDPVKLGLPVQAQITLKTATNDFRMLISKLREFPEILEVAKVTGDHCAFLKVVTKDNHHLERLIDRLTVYGHPNTSITLSNYSQKLSLDL